MREFIYTSKGSITRNVYRRGLEFVVLPGASFPDICVVCGNPAWGNVIKREFFDLGNYWFALPTPLDIVAFLFRKHYFFDFPFCSKCPPESFRLEKMRLNDYFGVFSGAPQVFLDSLPSAPHDVIEEMNRSWIERRHQ